MTLPEEISVLTDELILGITKIDPTVWDTVIALSAPLLLMLVSRIRHDSNI
jgi:hypothetical protein